MSTAAPELAPEVAAGLANLLGVVGDNKYWLGRHLSQWSVGTPGLESAVAATAIAQGHLGQSRAIFPVADELAGEGVDLLAPDQRQRRYNMASLDHDFEDWAQAAATLYLIDPALDLVLRSLQTTQAELGRRIARILEESRFNADFAKGRILELTHTFPKGRPLLATHLRRVLPEVMCWFGPSGERGVETLCAAGVLTRDNDGMRSHHLDFVMPLLLELGYDVGVTGEPGSWTYEELPWDLWNPLQRRLTG